MGEVVETGEVDGASVVEGGGVGLVDVEDAAARVVGEVGSNVAVCVEVKVGVEAVGKAQAKRSINPTMMHRNSSGRLEKDINLGITSSFASLPQPYAHSRSSVQSRLDPRAKALPPA